MAQKCRKNCVDWFIIMTHFDEGNRKPEPTRPLSVRQKYRK